jgi:hypothetical protein
LRWVIIIFALWAAISGLLFSMTLAYGGTCHVYQDGADTVQACELINTGRGAPHSIEVRSCLFVNELGKPRLARREKLGSSIMLTARGRDDFGRSSEKRKLKPSHYCHEHRPAARPSAA